MHKNEGTPEIGFELRCIQQMIHQKMEQFRQESGLDITFVQSRTIGFILHNEEKNVYQKDLEEKMKIRRSTATEILNVLERDGYLNRVPDENDGRLKKLVLTEKAIELDEIMHDNFRRMEALLCQNLTADQLKSFFEVLDQLKINLQGKDD